MEQHDWQPDDHVAERDRETAVTEQVIEEVERARDRVFRAYVRARERAQRLAALRDEELGAP